MLQKASRVPTLRGLKFSHNDMDAALACFNVNPKINTVFVGFDTIVAPCMAVGFDSILGTTLNIFPGLNLAIKEAVKTGDVVKIQEAQRKLSKASKAISKHGKIMNLTLNSDLVLKS
jgi:dihydrodipicolinate synthase/N-acetylneuraminate lyase